MEQCKSQRAAAQPPAQSSTSAASAQRPPSHAPQPGPSQQPQQQQQRHLQHTGAQQPVSLQHSAVNQQPAHIGPWPVAQQAQAFSQASAGQAWPQHGAVGAAPQPAHAAQQHPSQAAGPSGGVYHAPQHGAHVPRPLMQSGAVQSGAAAGPGFGGRHAQPLATAAQVASGVQDLELDDDWDDVDYDALDASVEAHQLQQQQHYSQLQQPHHFPVAARGLPAPAARPLQPLGQAAPQSGGAAAHAPYHSGAAGAYGSQVPGTGGQAFQAPQRVQPGAHAATVSAPGRDSDGGGGGVFDNAVRPLQGMSMRAQPQSGGQYDKAFAWTAELNELNHRHFHNPSFRGCQEQVRCMSACWTASSMCEQISYQS